MIQILQGIFTIIFSLIEALCTGVVELIVTAVPSKRNTTYNADFLNPSNVMSKHEAGFTFGDMSVSFHDSYSNALVLGNSGSGKTSCVLLNSLLKMDDASIITHDPSGELFLKSSGAMKAKGYRVLLIHYDDPIHSESYNPIERVRSISEIKQLSKLLVLSTLGNGGTDKFWNTAAESLLSLFIRYIKFYTEKENQNLYNVSMLLNQFAGTPKAVDRLIIETKDDVLIEEYKSFVAYDSKLLMNILATAKTALSLFSDDRIAQITCRDTIDFEGLREEKTIIYIRSNVNQMKYFSPLTSIFFEQLFAYIMKEIPTSKDLPIFHLMDEASSLYLPILSIAISNVRKYFSGMMLVFQTQSQIFDLYGTQQARNIISNCYTRCFLPGMPLETARELELILGKYQFEDENGNQKIRSLLTMDELRILDESIILMGNKPAIKMKLKPYYSQKNLLRLSQLAPVDIETRDQKMTEEYYKIIVV